jgi:hypothetical protein
MAKDSVLRFESLFWLSVLLAPHVSNAANVVDWGRMVGDSQKGDVVGRIISGSNFQSRLLA